MPLLFLPVMMVRLYLPGRIATYHMVFSVLSFLSVACGICNATSMLQLVMELL